MATPKHGPDVDLGPGFVDSQLQPNLPNTPGLHPNANPNRAPGPNTGVTRTSESNSVAKHTVTQTAGHIRRERLQPSSPIPVPTYSSPIPSATPTPPKATERAAHSHPQPNPIPVPDKPGKTHHAISPPPNPKSTAKPQTNLNPNQEFYWGTARRRGRGSGHFGPLLVSLAHRGTLCRAPAWPTWP